MTSMAELFDVYTKEELAFPQHGILTGSTVRPYVIFNMLSSVDGRANVQCTSATDRRGMAQLRAQVDGVIWGGGTIRHDPIALAFPADLLPAKLPFGIIWTRSGNLPIDHPIFQQKRSERLVFTMQTDARLKEIAQQARIHCVSSLMEMLVMLWQQYQIKTLLVEGGAKFNQLLLSHQIGEEIFLTLAPVILGDSTKTIVANDLPASIHLKCRSVKQINDELYLRYDINKTVKS